MWNGAGDEYQVVTEEEFHSPHKSLKLLGVPGWSSVAERRFTSSAAVLGYELSIMIGGRGSESYEHPGFFCKSCDAWGAYYGVVYFRHDDGTIRAEDGTVLGTWSPGKWYHLKVILDREEGTYTVWIDGVLVGEGLKIRRGDPENIEALALVSAHAGQPVYYDDVRVFEIGEGGQLTGDIWTDRGGEDSNQPGGTYEVGDEITIYFSVNSRVSVRVYDEFPNGTRKLLAQVGAEPGETYELRGVMGEPTGYRVFYLVGPSGEVLDSCRVEVEPRQPGCYWSVRTNKQTYHAGEVVEISIEPTPAIGVKLWLEVYGPDGSLVENIDCRPGVSSYSLVAGPDPGRYTVELWSQLVYPGEEPGLCATTEYEVVEAPVLKFRGVVHYAPDPYDVEIIIDEVLSDPEGRLKPGDLVLLDLAFGSSSDVWPLHEGERVEVLARHYDYGDGEPYAAYVWVYTSDHPLDGYVERIGYEEVKFKGTLTSVGTVWYTHDGVSAERMSYEVRVDEILEFPGKIPLQVGEVVIVIDLGGAEVDVTEKDVGAEVEVLGVWNEAVLLLAKGHYVRKLEFVLEPYDSVYAGQTLDMYFNDEVAGKYFPKFCVKPGAEPGPMSVFYRIFKGKDRTFGDLTIQYLVVFPRQEGWKPHPLDYSLIHIHLNRSNFKPVLIEYDAGFSPDSLELHSKGGALWEKVYKIDGRPVMIVKDAYHAMLTARSSDDLARCTTTEDVRLDRLSDDVLDHFYGLADIGTELGAHRLNQFLNGLGWNTMNPNEVVQPVTDVNMPWSVRVEERGKSIELNVVSMAGAKVSAFLTISSGNELKVYKTPVENVLIESGILRKSIKESDLIPLASYTTDPVPLDPRVRGVIAWIVIYYPDPGGAIVRRVTVKVPLKIFDPNTIMEIIESYFTGSESEFLGREPTADDVLLALDAYFGG